MNIFRLFGIGSDKIFAKDCQVTGMVTKVAACWWLSIKTKPVRLYASAHNTAHPHIITFEYTVENIPHTGKRYVPIRFRVPQKDETISVYYDPEKPQNYACCAFGPGTTL